MRVGSASSPCKKSSAVSFLRFLRARALALAGLLAAGCAAQPQDMAVDVLVHWQLADGRSCIDAAVIGVSLSAKGPSGATTPVTQSCPPAAPANTIVTVPALLPGMQLLGSGLSASSTILYRGELTVPDPVPDSLDLTLYFTGGL